MKNLQDIRNLRPCYDPTRYLPEDWEGNSLTILEHPDIPMQDKVWVVAHWMDDRKLRRFAVWCSRQSWQSEATLVACEVVEMFIEGRAREIDLRAAYSHAFPSRSRFVASLSARLAAISSFADSSALSQDSENMGYRAIGFLHSQERS